MTMITMQPPVETADPPPHPLFQAMLKERYQIYLQLLDQLAMYSRMPDCGGHEPAALAAMLTCASDGAADSANALQRISEGTYGPCERCGRNIPLGRLRTRPDARYCVSCERLQATGLGADTPTDIDLTQVHAAPAVELIRPVCAKPPRGNTSFRPAERLPARPLAGRRQVPRSEVGVSSPTPSTSCVRQTRSGPLKPLAHGHGVWIGLCVDSTDRFPIPAQPADEAS